MTAVDAVDAPWQPADDPETVVDFREVTAAHPRLAEFGAALGGTPLVEVPGPCNGARILAKCEWMNPVGSIKDRVAYALVCSALRGVEDPTSLRVLEYSGGNLASALATLASRVGFTLRVVLSDASAPSLLARLRDLGVQVDLVDRQQGFVAVIQRARDIAAEPGWTLLYQHRNPANVAFHELTTGAEMVAQLEGRAPDAWLTSIGTGGTLIGVLRALRGRFGDVPAYGVSPAELPYGSDEPPNGRPKYAGSGGLGFGMRQPFVHAYDDSIAGHINVPLPDANAAMVRLAVATGLEVGTSAAANWLAARKVAAGLAPDRTVITVFPDAGTPEEWARARGSA